MRTSCNGCRVLRKGCGDDCSIRPCLQWIRTPESQANATLFLAKFYGRAGLLNLINAGSDHHRPAIFRSLLYEACGRIVNPIYGSVGLLWSGSWDLCQSAVDAVLRGDPIAQMSSDAAASTPAPPIKAYDIRHVSRDGSDPRGVDKTRIRFKRSKKKGAAAAFAAAEESSGSHVTEQESCAFSVETAEVASHVSQGEPAEESEDVDLELTLGFERPSRAARIVRRDESEDRTCRVHLGLKLPS